jgi:S-adenosylmethionine hydrolase
VGLNVGHSDAMAAGIRLGSRVGVNGTEALVVQTFADVPAGELLLYEDAWRSLALAVNRGDAAALLGLQADSEVRLAPR